MLYHYHPGQNLSVTPSNNTFFFIAARDLFPLFLSKSCDTVHRTEVTCKHTTPIAQLWLAAN